MPEKKERFGQGILSMALANFDSWVHSPRTVLMLLFIIAICYLQMCGYKMTLNETGYTMHMGETLFYEFNFGCNMPMTTALFLIMVSELPRKIAYQQYSLIRSSRWKWMVAQILYCFMMVAAMVALILICIAIQALQVVTPGTGWSDIIRIAEKAIEPEEALVAQYFESIYTIHCFIAGDSSNVLLLVYNGVGHFDVWRVGSICCGRYGICLHHGGSCNHLL